MAQLMSPKMKRLVGSLGNDSLKCSMDDRSRASLSGCGSKAARIWYLRLSMSTLRLK
jgi:hypothetical protein